MVRIFNDQVGFVRAEMVGHAGKTVKDLQGVRGDFEGQVPFEQRTGNGVSVGFKMEKSLGIGFNRTDNGGVVWLGRERLKQRFFGGEPIKGPFAGGAVNTEVGFLVTPKDGLFLNLSPGGDKTTREESGADVFDAIFDFAFFPSGADVAGDGFKEVNPGEVQEAGVELNVSTDPSEDNGF